MRKILFISVFLTLTLLLATACGGVQEKLHYKISIYDGNNTEVYYGDEYYLRNERRSNIVSITVYESDELVLKKSAEGIAVTVVKEKSTD